MDPSLSDSQRRLLETVLSSEDQVGEAWSRWKEVGDLDTIDSDSFAILPLVYRRLRSLAREDDVVQRLASVYRQSTYRNQLVGTRLAPLLTALHEDGVSAIILSSVALSEYHHGVAGVRPFQVVQLAVRNEALTAAGDILERSGWHLQDSSNYRALRLGACCRYRHDSGFDLDLCHRVFIQSSDPDVTELFWKATTSVEFRGAPALILKPHAQLIQVCARSLASLGDTSLLWIVDAAEVIATAGDRLDRNQLILLARSTNTVLHLRERLRYLGSLVISPVAAEAVRELDKIAVSRTEQKEYELQGRTGNLLGRIPWMWRSYLLRSCRGDSVVLRPIAFVPYVRDVFGLSSVFQLPLVLARKLAVKIMSGRRGEADRVASTPNFKT
jgi:hypothetical protein